MLWNWRIQSYPGGWQGICDYRFHCPEAAFWDGRFIKDVDISLFINDLPNKKDTSCFFHRGCQRKYFPAAELWRNRGGKPCFPVDEDTSATIFMVRDAFMQRVISREKVAHHSFLERGPWTCMRKQGFLLFWWPEAPRIFPYCGYGDSMDNYRPVDITDKGGSFAGLSFNEAQHPNSACLTAIGSCPRRHRPKPQKDYYGYFKPRINQSA